MKLPTSPKKIILSFISLSLVSISCTKDSDVFNEAIAESIDDEKDTGQLVSKTVILNPLNDAYIQDGEGFNGSLMRVQPDLRTSYLMFDLSTIDGELENVELQLTVVGDSGDGTVKIYTGSHNEWSEEEISVANAPTVMDEVETLSKTYQLGSVEKIKVENELLGNDKISFVLTQEQGNDIALASKENTAQNGPKLKITYWTTDNSEDEVSEDSGPKEDDSPPSGVLKAFPNAFGGGSKASGGRGKALAIINTLNWEADLVYHPASDSNDEYYTGGLKAALTQEKVGYIVFNVSGNIELEVGGTGHSGLSGVNNKTLFGQSAPQGGITVTGGNFRFDGTKGDNQNLIFRYFRSRPIKNQYGDVSTEDDRYTWGLRFSGGKDIIVDHFSTSFAADKAIGASINETHALNNIVLNNLTFSNNLIADSNTGAYVEINPYRQGKPENFVDLISFNSNVIVAVNRTPNLAFNGRAEKINNIIYKAPSKQTTSYHALRLNEIGNYYSGNNSKNKIRDDIIDDSEEFPLIYSNSNFFEALLTGKSTEKNDVIWTMADGSTKAPEKFFVETPFGGFPHPITILSAEQSFENTIVNGNAGAYKYLSNDGEVNIYRDSFDKNQLSIVLNKNSYESGNVSNWVLPNIPENSRPDNYDSDNDGMADKWEIKVFGDLSQSYRGDFDNDGYQNIEEYMNQVDFN